MNKALLINEYGNILRNKLISTHILIHVMNFPAANSKFFRFSQISSLSFILNIHTSDLIKNKQIVLTYSKFPIRELKKRNY